MIQYLTLFIKLKFFYTLLKIVNFIRQLSYLLFIISFYLYDLLHLCFIFRFPEICFCFFLFDKFGQFFSFKLK